VIDAVPVHRRGLLVPAVVAMGALAVLLSLGTWQIERKAWKEGLIATLNQRIAAPAMELPAPASWDRLDPAKDEFRRVALRGQFLPDQEALVYTTGSGLRSDISGPGYWVFAPVRLADGSVVVINRGFVPEGRQDPGARADGQVSGPIDIIGAMRWPEARGLFTPADDPARNLWFVRDHAAMAAAKGWGTVAPFLIDQEQPQPPGGLPRPGKITPNLTNNHLQYALTWYGLAFVLVVAFIVWARSRRTERSADAERQKGA
jgi:surfeit locus 1 family protein